MKKNICDLQKIVRDRDRKKKKNRKKKREWGQVRPRGYYY